MPKLMLYGYPDQVAYNLELRIRELISQNPDIDDVVVTTVNSTVRDAKTGAPAPYIQVLSQAAGRKRLLAVLADLNEEIVVTP